jgi:ElaB/YqjD/DUF883 family membrane-anchored ribosome-binding protein
LQKQVAQMKRDIARINRVLAERAEEAVEDASAWWGDASDRASRATQAIRNQAQSVSGTIRDNPGTTSSAMLLGGLVGFAIGWLVSRGFSYADRRWF